MGRCNCWCDCFCGFDPETCFYIIGFTMSIFSLVLGIIDFVYYIFYLSGDIPGSQVDAYFMYFAVTIYIGNSIKSCCLCCTQYDDNPEKDLDTYNLLAFIAIVFAIVDGAFKLNISLPTSIIFFVYALLGIYFLMLTCQAREEVSRLSTRASQAEDGTVTVFPTNRNDAPRYPVPVHVERMELKGPE